MTAASTPLGIALVLLGIASPFVAMAVVKFLGWVARVREDRAWERTPAAKNLRALGDVAEAVGR